MNICITGYRPVKLPSNYGYDLNNSGYKNLSHAIRDVLSMIAIFNGDNKIKCISGMALGVDQLYVQTAIQLKNMWSKYFKVTITAAIPCRGHELKWPLKSRELYHELLKQCDSVRYIHNGTYTQSCMEERNRWMVDNSDAVIAVWDGKSGGTANCIRYARQKGKTIYIINPADYSVRREINDKK